MARKSAPSATIIGAGMVGVSAAWYLQEQGAHVTVLEAHLPNAGVQRQRRVASTGIDDAPAEPGGPSLWADLGVQPQVAPLRTAHLATWPGGALRGPDGGRNAPSATGMMEFRTPEAALDRQRLRVLASSIATIFPAAQSDLRLEEWVGARPCTADGLPLLGATAEPRVHVAGGHGMWGITLGPASGRLMAQSLAGNGMPADLAPLDPTR